PSCARSSHARSSARSGTTSRPATDGVDARTSAARSQSGVSCSWPTAEMTGTEHAATARTTRSSENGSRSSNAPPPRASTITSTPRAHRSRIAVAIAGAARAEAEALDRQRAQVEVAALLVELGAPVDVHTLTLDEVEPERVELSARHLRREARTAVRILEREVDGRPTLLPPQLGDLSL